MSVLVGTQLDLLSCIGSSNGIAHQVEQDPIEDHVLFISQTGDITLELYQYCDDLFKNTILIVDLETYGREMPENGEYNKKSTNAQGYKKGKTNGLQDLALSPIYGDIRLLQLAGLSSERILVVDFKTKWDRPQLSAKYTEFLDWLIERIRQFAARKGVPVGHNVGFDLGFFRAKYGIKFWKAYDTMIMSQLLSAGVLTHKHGLKDCCDRYLGTEVDKSEQKADNSLPLRNAQINYAASDIVNTGELFLILKNEIKIAGLEVVTEIEAEFTPALVEINYWGMPIDLAELDKQIKWYQKKLMQLDQEFQQIHPGLNIRSSQQIGGILTLLDKKNSDNDEEFENQIDDFESGVFEAIEVIKQSSSKSDLALLDDHQVVQLVVDFRTVSIYLNYCQQVRQEIIWIEGLPRVSGSIRQLTRKGQGRTCSGNKKAPVKCQGVNIQNPPSQKSINRRLKKAGCPNVRDIFRAKQIKLNPIIELYLITNQKLQALVWLMDFRIVDVDLPAAHLAIASYISGEGDVEKGIDRHAITMKCVFDEIESYKKHKHLSIKEISVINKDKTHKLFEEFTKVRDLCKGVVYSGLNFGSAPTLQTTIKVRTNEEVALPICEVMVDAFPKVLPKIAELRETLWKKANNNKILVDGYEYGTFQDDYGPFSTSEYRRRVYSLCKTNKQGIAYVPKGDIANCWLATEASSVKVGIASIYQKGVFTDKFDLRLSSVCHDEVILFCRKYQDIEVATLTQESMRQGLERFTGNGKIPYPDMRKSPRKLISAGWEH